MLTSKTRFVPSNGIEGTRQEGGFTRVVVCSDDQRAQQRLLPALQRDGHEVAGSSSIVELLGRLRWRTANDPSEILVLDAASPGFANPSVLEVIRETDWSLPIILVNGREDGETAELAQRIGIETCLSGPLDERAVRCAVACLAPPVSSADDCGGGAVCDAADTSARASSAAGREAPLPVGRPERLSSSALGGLDDYERECALFELVANGSVAALEILRQELEPVDYDEIGWGD